MQNNDQTRRAFLKQAIVTGVSLSISPFLVRCTQSNPYPDFPLLQENDPTAIALGYHQDADKVDSQKWAKKAGPEGGTQKCSSCTFYSTLDSKVGKCTLFPKNSVLQGGWCNTWTKKA